MIYATTPRRDGKFTLEIHGPSFTRTRIESQHVFDDLLGAAEFAEMFKWEVTELAGTSWYLVRDRKWVAVLGEGDTATIMRHDNGTFSMQREFRPRAGEVYEISASRYQSGDDDHSVRTFAEAAAITITLPAFLTVLGANIRESTQ